MLRHSPPHKAIVGGHDDVAPICFHETFEFARVDPAIHLGRADAAFSRELTDRHRVRVLEFLHRVALGI